MNSYFETWLAFSFETIFILILYLHIVPCIFSVPSLSYLINKLSCPLSRWYDPPFWQPRRLSGDTNPGCTNRSPMPEPLCIYRRWWHTGLSSMWLQFTVTVHACFTHCHTIIHGTILSNWDSNSYSLSLLKPNSWQRLKPFIMNWEGTPYAMKPQYVTEM